MQTLRPPDPAHPTDPPVSRFEQARIDAAKRVNDANNETGGLSGVAVYKFFGASAVQETIGFVTPGQAQAAILAATVTDDVTPLADAMCQVIQVARDSGSGAATSKRFLEVYTDGAENNSTAECAGPFSMVLHTAPFDSLPVPSWQNLVWNKSQNPLPIVQIDNTLYHDVSFAFAKSRASNPEDAKLAALGRSQPSAFAALTDVPVSDVEFFSALSAGTGGFFTEVIDTEPVPVVGDLDGDFDVDRDDAIILARAFGTPATHAFDLNDDGKIGFGDYALLLPKFGEGSGTPAPDPYVQNPPINCVTGTVTLTGKVIENGGITINTIGACRVIIKNSLIVSGAAAIKVMGTALFEIDNSIIVGEGQWLNSTGASVVSAANTVFHGPRKLIGAFVFLDRGGNTIE